MKNLVKHWLDQHLDEIEAKSLRNCHVKGLDSIMFLDTPEQRIRLFIARPEHELWQNDVGSLGSLAAHSHHCDITLDCVKGAFINLEYKVSPQREAPFQAYRYQSSILTGTGSFTRDSDYSDVQFKDFQLVEEGRSLLLPAEFIHSVYVTKGRVAAWFVYEGKENENYFPLSYSDKDLSKTDFSELYQPIDKAEILSLLHLINLL